MIKSDEYNGVCVLSITGELAGEECASARKIVESEIDTRHVVNFAIDMEKCEFVDSEGLEFMLWLKRKCDELFGMMKVVAPDETCRRILHITRLDKRFDIESDLSFALKSMR